MAVLSVHWELVDGLPQGMQSTAIVVQAGLVVQKFLKPLEEADIMSLGVRQLFGSQSPSPYAVVNYMHYFICQHAMSVRVPTCHSVNYFIHFLSECNEINTCLRGLSSPDMDNNCLYGILQVFPVFVGFLSVL